jgi:hypothetical protein
MAAVGSVYCFGDAPFYGSEKGSGLSQPIVGLAASPWGMGYWLLSAGGQVFDFGGAPYEVAVSASGPGAPSVGLAA